MQYESINYKVEPELGVEEFIGVLVRSTLGERRPVSDRDRIDQMLTHANLIITARSQIGELVGVARCVTDFVYCSYLSDLAVDLEFQHRGIGKQLIREVKIATPKAKLILLSAPDALNYYPKIGMTRSDRCFVLDNLEELT
jgi:ribosomal protein S18 acetylase RimI-like enzyme